MIKKNYGVKMSILAFSFFLIAIGCSKDTGGANNSPANLVVNATVLADNSGNVSFVATATNAVTYEYNFGNGSFLTVPSGVITYKYAATGNYTVSVVAKSSGGQSVSNSIQVNVTVALTLLWADEFNIDGAPDPAKWGYDLGDGCPSNCGWGNNEEQFYTSRADNVIVSGGTIKIMAKKESFSGKPYTSARLLSKGKFAFTYGRVEARAKLPAGVGTWPAIWMLGANVSSAGWPACGEIDIMEHLGRDLNKIYGTLHYPGRSGGNADGGTKLITNATTEFHIYTLDWSTNFIRIFVDGELVHSVANSNSIPFNQDFFLILNVAMGGNFPGPVATSFTTASMEVDYIRVYR